MKITILGAGAWGTALARHLHASAHELTLWDHDTPNLLQLPQSGRNDKYLPGIDLPKNLQVEPDVNLAWQGSDCVVVAVPSRVMRETTRVLSGFTGTIVTVTKGIEYDTGLTMSGVLQATAPRARIAALSGPTLAMEVARNVPTAAVVASEQAEVSQAMQKLFHSPSFRIYTSADILGVELGGALKNVIAVAAGICDGLGFGDNSKAALITRAIVEIRRLGVACGAQAETFAGLGGLGDLVVTCFSKLSRNRALGEKVGRGEKPSEVLARSVTVAEGYPTARAAWQLARKHEVSVPIIDEVYAMLHLDKPAADAVRDLMGRDSKAEE